jgi:hypothetical protein
LAGEFQPTGGWVGTRFWYYPDSVEVETDPGYEYARIASPQFMADAERSQGDFSTPEDFERFKQLMLSPAIRQNIDHLNAHFVEYAAAFPELRELGTVARLMGICCRLRRADVRAWLDSDALLSVDLPACQTETERTQMVATAGLTVAASATVTPRLVRDSLEVRSVGADLERTVAEVFPQTEQLAGFLCRAAGKREEDWPLFADRAGKLLSEAARTKVKVLIESKSDLKAFAEVVSEAADFLLPEEFRVLEQQIQERQGKLDDLEARIQASALRIEGGNATEASVSAHNRLVDEYNREATEVSASTRRFNSMAFGTRVVCEIGGGIDLGPDQFSIRPVARSPALDAFRSAAQVAGTDWTSFGEGPRWIRSASGSGVSAFKNDLPKSNWQLIAKSRDDGIAQEQVTDGQGQVVWVQRELAGNVWRDFARLADGTWRERHFDRQAQELRIAVCRPGGLTQCSVAKMESPNRITFRPVDRGGLVAPQGRPLWWQATSGAPSVAANGRL